MDPPLSIGQFAPLPHPQSAPGAAHPFGLVQLDDDRTSRSDRRRPVLAPLDSEVLIASAAAPTPPTPGSAVHSRTASRSGSRPPSRGGGGTAFREHAGPPTPRRLAHMLSAAAASGPGAAPSARWRAWRLVKPWLPLLAYGATSLGFVLAVAFWKAQVFTGECTPAGSGPRADAGMAEQAWTTSRASCVQMGGLGTSFFIA
jgi:hypothetical protein